MSISSAHTCVPSVPYVPSVVYPVSVNISLHCTRHQPTLFPAVVCPVLTPSSAYLDISMYPTPGFSIKYQINVEDLD